MANAPMAPDNPIRGNIAIGAAHVVRETKIGWFKDYISPIKSSHKVLVDGYVREQSKILSPLSMKMEYGISSVVHAFYPKYVESIDGFTPNIKNNDNDNFQLSFNNSVIQGSLPLYSASRRQYIYTNGTMKNGYNKGIHHWTLRSFSHGNNTKVGVVAQPNLYRNYGLNPENSSLIKANPKWPLHELFTIELNCNDWSVTYYTTSRYDESHHHREHDLEESDDNQLIFDKVSIVHKDKITPFMHYYFVLCIEDDKSYVYQVMETPAQIISKNPNIEYHSFYRNW